MKRHVLITGPNGRLGQSFFARHSKDYFIIGVSRSEPKNGVPSCHFFFQGDITESPGKIVSRVLGEFGRIDLLINNAATYAIKPLDQVMRGEMDQVFATNVIAPHNLAREVYAQHWSSDFGNDPHIINISSVSATNVYENQGAYAASKAALNMLSFNMARDYYPVRVSVLSPTGFPRIVPTERVADELVNLDRSEGTGHLVEVWE